MAVAGGMNFDAAKLSRIGDEGAMRVLIKKGFELANDIKQSFGDSGIAGASRKDRESNRSKPGEPPHVQTGRLRASISVNWEASGMENGNVDSLAEREDGVVQPEDKFTVRVGTNVEYARGLEFGTSRVAPRPFLRPALDRLR